MTIDGDDRSEQLDDDKLGDEFPPEAPLAVQDYGTTPAEERMGEPLAERVAREEPDVDAGGAGHDAAMAASPSVLPGVTTDQLDDDDDFAGDETRRDVATEKEAPVAAEVAAMRVVDEDHVA